MSTINPIGREPGRRVRQGRSRSRDRARLRALIVLLVLVLVSAIAVWLIVRSEAKGETPRADPCAVKSGTTAAIEVRVLNATSREGLAGSVATELRKRGYTVTSIGNEPRAVPGTAEVRYGSRGAPAARAMAALVVGSKGRKDKRTGTDVDLVLGDRFRALVPGKAAPLPSGCPASVKPTGSPRPA